MENIDIIDKYLMEGDNVDIIYLDFSKVLDMLSFTSENEKLSYFFKKKKKEKKLIFSDIFDRTMKVKIGDNYFQMQNTTFQCSSGISTVFFFFFFLLFLIFINDLPNDIKSEIELFVGADKLLMRWQSKEKTRMDQNKLSNWKYIWK